MLHFVDRNNNSQVVLLLFTKQDALIVMYCYEIKSRHGRQSQEPFRFISRCFITVLVIRIESLIIILDPRRISLTMDKLRLSELYFSVSRYGDGGIYTSFAICPTDLLLPQLKVS